jgi:hypothetical protein
LKVKHRAVREESLPTFMPDVLTGESKRKVTSKGEVVDSKKKKEKAAKKHMGEESDDSGDEVEKKADAKTTKKEDDEPKKVAEVVEDKKKAKKEKKEKAVTKDPEEEPTKRVKTVAPGVEVELSDATWTCVKCSNVNFAKRDVCNSKMCNERKPGSIAPSSAEPLPKAVKSLLKGKFVTSAVVITTLQPSHLAASAATSSESGAAASAEDPNLEEAGSWTCAGCGNHNYASRSNCNTKTCRQSRPANSYPAAGGSMTRPSRPPVMAFAKPAVVELKKLVWPEQGGPEKIKYNEELRARSISHPESLDAEETARAAVLADRDARKKVKKVQEKASKEVEKTRIKEMRKRQFGGGGRGGGGRGGFGGGRGGRGDGGGRDGGGRGGRGGGRGRGRG